MAKAKGVRIQVILECTEKTGYIPLCNDEES